MQRLLVLLLNFMLGIITLQAQVMKGKVTDKNHKPIELAVVVIQTTDSVYVNSTYTDSLGRFTIETNVCPFLLTVQHLMYETCCRKYDSAFIETIQLDEKDLVLSEVSVRGERPVVKVVDGKLTYDMPQLLKDRMVVSAYEAI